MKPFNLAEFKAGQPALTRDGRIATFAYDDKNSNVIAAHIDGELFGFCQNGKFLVFHRFTHDLVAMTDSTSGPATVSHIGEKAT
ncbi:MAG: hypothetical protein LBI48_09570 [Burkholderiaceae bacterium]|jgi:hypothetical protein|nr:hypothetical protein [Burkholderiaceae bacterium]